MRVVITDGPREKPVTISTVAARANVSVASVSRVLNGDVRVGARIREDVEAAVREIGYTPNAAARSLRARATRQLGLVVDDIGNPPYVEIMRSMQEVAREAGHRLLLQSSDGRVDEELAILGNLGQRYVDGLVMTSTRFVPSVIELLHDPPIPIVIIGSPPELPVDCVSTDTVGGVSGLVGHLIEQGCRRLAMINGPTGTLPAQTRLLGFLNGAADGGAAVSVVLHAGAWDRDAGQEVALHILDRDERPDAIVCATDQLALGALDACLDRGVDVPGELALAGIDNSRDAMACRPRLTSLDLSFAERGRIAARLLLDRIRGEVTGDPQRIRVDTQLVVRDSSRFGGGT